MANASAVLALVGAIVAAITALIVLDILLIVPAGFAVVAGIYIALQQKQNVLVLIGGALAAVVGLVVILGTTMGWLGAGLGAALTILANLEVAATALKTSWGELPKAGSIVVAVALAVAAILALVFSSSLGLADIVVTVVVAVGSLAGIYPAVTAMRE